MAIEALNNLPEHIIDHAALGVKSETALKDTFVELAGDTMTGNLTISKADPTITFTDTGDSNSATIDRSDTNALLSHKNTAQEGGVVIGINLDSSNDDYCSFATTTLFDGNKEQTIALWIKIIQDKGGSGYWTIFEKFTNTDAERSYKLAYRDVTGTGNDRLEFKVRDSTASPTYPVNTEWVITGSELNDGNWHHLAVSWNFNTGAFRLYKDGSALVSTTPFDTSKTQWNAGTNHALSIGDGFNAAASVEADFDEMAIWQRALTAAEVSDLYNSGSGFYITTSKTFASTGTSCGTSLVGLWHMDENTGTTIADSSTSGITGTFAASTRDPSWTTGKVTGDGTDYTVTYLSHQDGGSGIRGLTTLGNTLGDTYVNGKTVYLQIAGTNEVTLTAAAISPSTTDSNALGTTSLMWSDLFLASGGVLNFNAGDVTVTHSSNTLAFAGATIYTWDALLRWGTGVAITAAQYEIGRDADGTNQLHFNVPTGATFEWSVNDVAQMTLSASTLSLPVSGSIINFNSSDVTITHSSNTLTFAGATNYSFDDKITASGETVFDGTTTSSGAGAVGVTGSIHEITTTGVGNALTLANGTEGQRLFIVYVAEGAGTDTAILTPTSMGNGTTVTFAVVGDNVSGVFTNGKWYFQAQGAVIA